MENYQKLCVVFSVSIGLFYFFYLTLNNQVFGIDAWYWLKFGFQKPLYQNIVMLIMWISVFLFFKLSGKENPYFFASLFLLMPFNIRLLEVELDDYIFTLFSFLILASVKKFRKYIAFLIILFYLAVYSFFIYSDKVHLEITWNLSVISLVIPFFLMLAENKNWKDLFVALILCVIFSYGKFVGSAFPVYAFAVFLEMKEISMKKTLPFILIFSLVIYFVSVINLVEANKIAFEKYCNRETKICNNYEEPHYGHYFAWLGYISNNTYEFGVCTCVGDRCLNKTIEC